MKKIIKTIALCIAAAAFTACSDDQRGDVISQDTSYEVDQDYVFVDIPPVFDFDPSNIVYLKGKTVVKLTGKHSDGVTQIKEGTEFEFSIRLKRALDKDVVIRLKEDRTLLDEYPDGADLMSFPESTASVSEVTMKAGTKEAIAKISLNNINMLNEMPGYILPLRLEISDALSDILISSEFYSVIVQLNIELGKENIDPSNEEIPGIQFNDIITFESNRSRYLEDLYDGDHDTYWDAGSEEAYLLMTLPSPMKILGIRFVLKSSFYALGQMNVYAKESKGFMSYGRVERDTKGKDLYLRFKEPTEITSIKLDGLRTAGGRKYAEIYEIYFIR